MRKNLDTDQGVAYTNYLSDLPIFGKKAALHSGVEIWVLRNGTCEPGQGRNTAAISRQSHVP